MVSTRKSGVSRRSLLKTATALSTFGPLFQATRGNSAPRPNRTAPTGIHPERSEDHRHARCNDRLQLRLPDHSHRYEPGCLWFGGGLCSDMISQALLLKPFVVGRNPLEIDTVLARLRNLTGQDRVAGV